jgi:hypothetical protein
LHPLACWFALPKRLFSQAVYGSIVGVVTDTTRTIVGKGAVTIRDVALTTTTNESANYSQRHLIVGRCEVKVDAPGFRTFIETNLNVSVGAEVRLDVKLELGEVKEVVEVTSEPPLLKTEQRYCRHLQSEGCQ